jgi:DNA modification methylase
MNLMLGDCLDKLQDLPDNSVDSIVTDPPYGLGFMGKQWDTFDKSQFGKAGEEGENDLKVKKNFNILPRYNTDGLYEFTRDWAKECLRVLKPGGYILSFAGSRTYHKICMGIEDAGFEIRDQIMWVYGSGFPKSHNVANSIDKKMGHGNRGRAIPAASTHFPSGKYATEKLTSNKVEPYKSRSPESEPWQGWGTALKPAHEPIVMARKPFKGTVADNVLEYGTGAINIDDCRVGTETISTHNAPKGTFAGGEWDRGSDTNSYKEHEGRYPANFIHDGIDSEWSHYFYCPKASKKDRNAGCEGLEDKEWKHEGAAIPERANRPFLPSKNNHPTVKPQALMAYLCRLITQPGGVVLDPFMGSGSTGRAALAEGFDFIGIEREPEYFNISLARINNGRS